MKTRFIALATGVLAGCLLAGCAATGGQPAVKKAPIPPPSATGTTACFYVRQVQNFRVLDRSNLIVYAPNDANAYHVRISPPSTELRFADSLAFLPVDGRICGYAGERLIVGGGRPSERLAILDVSRLSPDGLAALRADSTAPELPVAKPGPGAEVETGTKADSP